MYETEQGAGRGEDADVRWVVVVRRVSKALVKLDASDERRAVSGKKVDVDCSASDWVTEICRKGCAARKLN